MKKRFAALCLTCSALLSLSAPAAAVRAPNDSGQPQSSTGNTSVTIPSDGTLSFDQIGPRVKANNLTLKAAHPPRPWTGMRPSTRWRMLLMPWSCRSLCL